MATIKTTVNDKSVIDFIAEVPDEIKQRDSLTLLDLFSKITGEPAKMWGPSIVGFGSYHYKSERSKQEGDWPLIGFSPRKQSLSLYIMLGLDDYTSLLARLGKHKTGKGCLYINKLSDVDAKVLEELVQKSFTSMKQRYNA